VERLLLLGCGTVGRQALRWLARNGPFRSFLLADRDPERPPALAREAGLAPGSWEPLALDLTDRPALLRAFARADLVLNTVGPFFRHGRYALACAVEAGVAYVDVNDDADSVREILEDTALLERAHRTGQPYLVGAGTSPGVTAHLARLGALLLDRVHAVHTYLSASISWRGESVFAHLLYVLGRPALWYCHGSLERVAPFTRRERVHFPGTPRPVPCYPAGHPEPVTLPRHFPDLRCATMRLGRFPGRMVEALRHLYEWGLLDPEPLEGTGLSPLEFTARLLAHGRARPLARPARPLSARLVRLEGERNGAPARVRCAFTGPPVTGQDAGLLAGMLARGDLAFRGIETPEVADPWKALPPLLAEGGLFRVALEGVGEWDSLDALRAFLGPSSPWLASPPAQA